MPDLPPTFLLSLGIILGGLVAAFFVWAWFQLTLRGRLAEARRVGIEQSRSTLKGKMAEQMAPLLEGFPYLPAESRFLGDPIDYLVFSGYTQVKDDAGPAGEVEVVLLDIKHGQSKLSSSQRAIAQAVEAGRVRFEVVRIDEQGQVTVQRYASRRRGRE